MGAIKVINKETLTARKGADNQTKCIAPVIVARLFQILKHYIDFAREVLSGGTMENVSIRDSFTMYVGQARHVVPCFF